jgi:hypothetical protein
MTINLIDHNFYNSKKSGLLTVNLKSFITHEYLPLFVLDQTSVLSSIILNCCYTFTYEDLSVLPPMSSLHAYRFIWQS